MKAVIGSLLLVAGLLTAADAYAVPSEAADPARTAGRVYPPHTGIVATTFWVGEVFDPRLPDGSQVCSTYDSQWAYHWSGVSRGRVPRSAG